MPGAVTVSDHEQDEEDPREQVEHGLRCPDEQGPGQGSPVPLRPSYASATVICMCVTRVAPVHSRRQAYRAVFLLAYAVAATCRCVADGGRLLRDSQ
jgi:hypothetical protein